jgi:hypothetical protein
MKVFIWNSDGLGDSAKHITINESVREHCLDFVVISETGRSNFSAPFLRHLSAGFDFSWFFYLPKGALVVFLRGLGIHILL